MDLSWYEKNIEPKIREAVFVLRNHGINTIGSCEHEGWITIIPEDANDMFQVEQILIDAEFNGFETKYIIYSDGIGLSRARIEVQFL